jgi:hypothetical protein
VTKTKERIKKTGEVFTPSWLVNQMLDKIDESSFSTPGKTFVDPACGNGNILVEVVRRKIKNGCTAYQSLMTTYGVDIMPDNIDECRERLIDVAYEATSTIRHLSSVGQSSGFVNRRSSVRIRQVALPS